MRPQQILIADDDEKVVALLKSSLQKSGYATLEAFDGEGALHQATTQKPDLILADVTMPKMDGFELCKHVRENPETEHIPFVFLTAKGELNDRVNGLNLGADDYISKPFHISEVTARIKAILQRTASVVQPPKEDDSDTDLKGNLQQLNLGEILQTLGMTQKSGGLKIISESRVGKIFFDKGKIVQASLGKYKSEEAVYRIVSWDEGFFEFDSNDRAEKSDINAGTNSLLMEGFRQRDEYSKYKRALPPFESILEIVDVEQTDEEKPAAQRVIALVDGKRTIQDVINISPINYLMTVKVIHALLKKRTIKVIDSLGHEVRQKDYGQLAHELYE